VTCHEDNISPKLVSHNYKSNNSHERTCTRNIFMYVHNFWILSLLHVPATRPCYMLLQCALHKVFGKFHWGRGAPLVIFSHIYRERLGKEVNRRKVNGTRLAFHPEILLGTELVIREGICHIRSRGRQFSPSLSRRTVGHVGDLVSESHLQYKRYTGRNLVCLLLPKLKRVFFVDFGVYEKKNETNCVSKSVLM